MDFCTTYAEVKRYHGTSFRDYLRNIALDTLSILMGDDAKNALYAKPRVHFLYFHHIFEDEAEGFERFVALLAEKHRFISHSEAVDKLVNGTVDQPYITWSSDDGFKNNLIAAEILNRYDASCCFFVNPDTINLEDKEKIFQFCDTKLIMPPIEFMTWSDLEKLLYQGHEIGSHTMSLDNVSGMALSDFEEDLVMSKRILEQHCGPIRHFAYPYGRYDCFSKDAYDLVFKTGYDSCSTAVRGSHWVNEEGIPRDKLFIRRDQIIAAWKLSHLQYFVANSVIIMSPEGSILPY